MHYPTLKDDETGVDYTSISFSAAKRIPNSIKQLLKHCDRWEDVLGEIFLASLESFRLRSSPNDTYNNAKRKIYSVLKANGFRLVRDENNPKRAYKWKLKEISFETMPEPNEKTSLHS
jgi:hypothetical protein